MTDMAAGVRRMSGMAVDIRHGDAYPTPTSAVGPDPSRSIAR